MKLNELSKRIYFHDSSINEVKYDENKKLLSARIELCNYMQTKYTESMPEIVLGKLIFHDVSECKTDPILPLNFIDGQILVVNLISLNTLKFEIVMFNFKEQSESYLSLTISCMNVIWNSDILDSKLGFI